jgi:hypothetical protein
VKLLVTVSAQRTFGMKPVATMAAQQHVYAMPGPDSSDEQCKEWVYQQYLEHGFNNYGFKGYKKLKSRLTELLPGKLNKPLRKRILTITEE